MQDPDPLRAQKEKELVHLNDNIDMGQFWADFSIAKYKECAPSTGVALVRFPETQGNLSGDVETRLAGHDTGPQGSRPPSATRGDRGLARALTRQPQGRSINAAQPRTPGNSAPSTSPPGSPGSQGPALPPT